MKIENLKVYDLEESLVASGFAMRTEVDSSKEPTEKDWKRGLNLVKASNGNGAHAQWLTGVNVSFDLTCSIKMWTEIERYRFCSFVTSQSTMHRIAKFDLNKQCNEWVCGETLEILEKLKNDYNANPTPENYLKLLYNVSTGFELTARLTTNYRCLLNMYIQRFNHRLPEWRDFCAQLLELPHFKEIVEAYEGEENETNNN